MYDHLTKLSLNHEKEVVGEGAEAKGCDCTGNDDKNSNRSARLESEGRFLTISMPEENLNLEIVSAGEGENVQIGFADSERFQVEKKTARKSELWHADDGRKCSELMTTGNEESKYGVQKKGVSSIVSFSQTENGN